jgi:hypothetical protein
MKSKIAIRKENPMQGLSNYFLNVDDATNTLKIYISLNYYIVKYSVTILKYSIVHYI